MSFLALLLALPYSAIAASEGMREMPQLHEQKTYIIPSSRAGETLLRERGFGNQEPEVRMMNLMMVGGSGMEEMAMHQVPPAHRVSGDARYSVETKSQAFEKGSHLFLFKVADAKSGHLATGLAIKAELSMASMDMGTKTPAVEEGSPGEYRVMLSFTMSGLWALKLTFPDEQEELVSLHVGTM